jgi:hypothetical protein
MCHDQRVFESGSRLNPPSPSTKCPLINYALWLRSVHMRTRDSNLLRLYWPSHEILIVHSDNKVG